MWSAKPKRASPPTRMLAAIAAVTAAVSAGNAGRVPAAALSAAPVIKVQAGTVAHASGATVTPTLPSVSTAGTLLLATVTSQKNAGFTGPTGWVRAVRVGQTNADAEIWYYANNPGGITSASFSDSGATSTTGQLSEWSGVATSSPLDKTGSTTVTLATSVAPATTAATTLAGELAVTAAAQWMALAGTATYTPGTGWGNLGNSGATSSSFQYDADYRTQVPVGTVS
jgi:hypothetical protein